jgi:prepilin signal peptidase PulO-like enzyme (type II secretory pathway)
VLLLSLIMDKVLKKDTMGGGDIKLLFVIGLYLTLPECLLMVMLSCVIGIVMAAILMRVDSETAFPFGPALSIAAVLTMLVGSPIVNWYLSLF